MHQASRKDRFGNCVVFAWRGCTVCSQSCTFTCGISRPWNLNCWQVRDSASDRPMSTWERSPGACSRAGSPQLTPQGSFPGPLSWEFWEQQGLQAALARWCLRGRETGCFSSAWGRDQDIPFSLIIAFFLSCSSEACLFQVLINSWLASAQMWAVILHQERVAVFVEWEMGETSEEPLCFIRVALSDSPQFDLFFFFLPLPRIYKGGAKVG